MFNRLINWTSHVAWEEDEMAPKGSPEVPFGPCWGSIMKSTGKGVRVWQYSCRTRYNLRTDQILCRWWSRCHLTKSCQWKGCRRGDTVIIGENWKSYKGLKHTTRHISWYRPIWPPPSTPHPPLTTDCFAFVDQREKHVDIDNQSVFS